MFKYRRWGLTIALVASFATSILPPMAIAKGIPSRWAAKRYKVPAVGIPLRREAAATRGGCPVDRLTALMPPDGMAATTTAYPTLFFSVPTLLASNSLPAEFTLKDGNQIVYQTKFQLVGNRRTIPISLPSTGQLAPLKIDRDYQWSLIVQCSNEPDSDRIVTTGIIRRVVPDAALAAKLQAFSQATPAPTNPPQLPEIYAEAEIWQDALMELANLRRLQPKNSQVMAQWQSLLKSADLGAVANDSF